MFPYFYPGQLPLWYNYYYYYYNRPAVDGFDEESDDGCDDSDDCRLMHGGSKISEDKEIPPIEHYAAVHTDNKRPIGKDDFAPGFVPDHNHASVDYTSVNFGHVHQCLDITFPPTPSDGTHVHYTEGYVLFENGHNHHYKACSGPAIPVGNGMHVHNYDFYTTESSGHRHHVTGIDIPAPGTL